MISRGGRGDSDGTSPQSEPSTRKQRGLTFFESLESVCSISWVSFIISFMNLNPQRNINKDIFNIQVFLRNVLPMNLLKLQFTSIGPMKFIPQQTKFKILKMGFVFYCQAINKYLHL